MHHEQRTHNLQWINNIITVWTIISMRFARIPFVLIFTTYAASCEAVPADLHTDIINHYCCNCSEPRLAYLVALSGSILKQMESPFDVWVSIYCWMFCCVSMTYSVLQYVLTKLKWIIAQLKANWNNVQCEMITVGNNSTLWPQTTFTSEHITYTESV